MKKILVFLMVGIFVFGLSACKKESNTSSEAESAFQSQIETESIDNTESSSEEANSIVENNGTSEITDTSAVTSSTNKNKTSGGAVSQTPKTCKHKFANATCTTPKICTLCNVTEGTALGHNWQTATCTTPQICKVCGITEGSAIHNFYAGFCKLCKTSDDSFERLYSADKSFSIAVPKAWAGKYYANTYSMIMECDYYTDSSHFDKYPHASFPFCIGIAIPDVEPGYPIDANPVLIYSFPKELEQQLLSEYYEYNSDSFVLVKISETATHTAYYETIKDLSSVYGEENCSIWDEIIARRQEIVDTFKWE